MFRIMCDIALAFTVFFYYLANHELNPKGIWLSFCNTVRFFLILFGVEHLIHCLVGI